MNFIGPVTGSDQMPAFGFCNENLKCFKGKSIRRRDQNRYQKKV